MKHTRLLYGLITVLGIAFVTMFFPMPVFSPSLNLFSFISFSFIGTVNVLIFLLITCFFSIVGTVFLIAGIFGMVSPYLENSQKLSKLQLKLAGKFNEKYSFLLFGLITILGTIFLTIFFIGYYWNSIGVRNFLTLLPYTQLGSDFILFCLFGGTTILAVGICGIVRRYLKHNQNLFTVLVAILIPSLVFLPFCYLWIGPLAVGF